MGFRDGRISTPHWHKITTISAPPSAGGTISFVIPPGRTLAELYMRFTIGGVAATEAQIIAQLTRLEIELNADTKIKASGRTLVREAKRFQGASAIADGVLPLLFWLIEKKLVPDQVGAAWGMANTTSARVTLTFDGAATIDGLEAHYASWEPENLDEHLTLKEHSDSFTSTGWHDWEYLPKPNERILSIGLYDAALDITHLRCSATLPDGKTRNFTPEDGIPVRLLTSKDTQAGRLEQADWQAIDFDLRDYVADAIRLDATRFYVGANFGTAPGQFTRVEKRLVIEPVAA